jgi:hypothetical protein
MTQIELIQKKTWLTEKEAVEYTGFHPDVLRRFRTEGTGITKLPYSKIGTSIRYKRTEIDEFFKAHSPTI